jgi:hypothetical protein
MALAEMVLAEPVLTELVLPVFAEVLLAEDDGLDRLLSEERRAMQLHCSNIVRTIDS